MFVDISMKVVCIMSLNIKLFISQALCPSKAQSLEDMIHNGDLPSNGFLFRLLSSDMEKSQFLPPDPPFRGSNLFLLCLDLEKGQKEKGKYHIFLKKLNGNTSLQWIWGSYLVKHLKQRIPSDMGILSMLQVFYMKVKCSRIPSN